ncbi:hypothetical protein CJU89_3957 [Yarrowia sp. B02]|nr:hypothetical protein CJU89_3957 [Yarrowia sp. B02]
MSATKNSVTFKNGNGNGITNAANLFHPPNFDKSKSYAGIVVGHPAGGVKEQTAGTYAEKLAEKGFVTIVFDASYQGDSTGEPRGLEDPYIRTEDNSAAVNYLTTLPYVENTKIGILGVCASGGYAVNAAINDKRIKAVGTVSAVNLGYMYRAGWDGKQKDIALPTQQLGDKARTEQAEGKPVEYLSFAPESREAALLPELEDAYDYYLTPRAQHKNSTSKFTVRSLNQLTTYDAFHLAKDFLTQPLLMVAGSEAGTKFYSEFLPKEVQGTSKDASNYFIQGSNHFDLYDKPKPVEEAVSKLAPFYEKWLQ